ncbi:MAG: hypothetical protein QM765_51350 [Myxococcales bacterium]
MKRTIQRPKSVLKKLQSSLAKALPEGLPAELTRFYEAGDGRSFTLEFDREKETATIEGLMGMFGGEFRPPTVVKDLEDADEALNDGPFQDVFYNQELDLEDAGRARLNLLLRLKLVSSLAGESAAIGIDLYGGKRPQLYYVQDACDAWPLALGFGEFVGWFEKFGGRRWYFAFLDAKAERGMNIDLPREFDASMAGFAEEEVAPLRARFARPAKPREAKKAAQPTKAAAAVEPKAPKGAVDAKSIQRWPLELPPMKAPYLADPWQRDHDALLTLGTESVGRAETIALVTRGVRDVLGKKKWAELRWAAVLLASEALTEDEIVKLVELYMPADALAVLTKLRRWKATKLEQLAEGTKYGWKKKAVPPHVSQTFAEAAAKLKAKG